MESSTLGGTFNGIARGHVLPPVREGRVSKVLADRLEVAVRSLNGDVQTLAARGWHPQIEDTDDGPVMILPKRGDRAWVADDEGRALVVVTWQRVGPSDETALIAPGPNVGLVNPTFTASATSSVIVVTHGLGSTPVNVQCTFRQIPTPAPYTIVVASVDATTFTITVYASAPLTSTACLIYWMAVA